MKNWALIVAGLYFLTLMVLTVPFSMAVFWTIPGWKDIGDVYGAWQYWLLLAVLALAQFALLATPVRVASRRPTTRGALWPTLLAGGLMIGGLAAGACCAIMEFLFSDTVNGNVTGWTVLGIGMLSWAIWTLVFFRMSRRMEATDWVSHQSRALFKGSILELLVAVPTHIIVRQRDYCCAGTMTFIGLTAGVAVMLFSFGPAVFFLFLDRWKIVHPANATS